MALWKVDSFHSDCPVHVSSINHYRDANIITQTLLEQGISVFTALNEIECRVLLATPPPTLKMNGDLAFVVSVDNLQNSFSVENKLIKLLAFS